MIMYFEILLHYQYQIMEIFSFYYLKYQELKFQNHQDPLNYPQNYHITFFI